MSMPLTSRDVWFQVLILALQRGTAIDIALSDANTAKTAYDNRFGGVS